MTDDPKDQRRRDHDDFTERGGWQKDVKPPTAEATAPGPAPKTVNPPAPAPAAESQGSSNG